MLNDFRNPKMQSQGFQSKLLFKKRMFRESDETVTEAQFVNLSYVQAQFDYLQGNYPVVREDAAQMCALQMQSEFASTLLENEELIFTCIEKFITKAVSAQAGAAACATAQYILLTSMLTEALMHAFQCWPLLPPVPCTLYPVPCQMHAMLIVFQTRSPTGTLLLSHRC